MGAPRKSLPQGASDVVTSLVVYIYSVASIWDGTSGKHQRSTSYAFSEDLVVIITTIIIPLLCRKAANNFKIKTVFSVSGTHCNNRLEDSVLSPCE